MSEQGREMLTQLEFEVRSELVAELGQFNLGQEDGIKPEIQTNEETEAYLEQLKNCVVEVTDTEHYACIDGRETLAQADGSPRQERQRIAGGSITGEITAVLGESPIVDAVSPEAGLSELLETVDQYFERELGIKKCGHEGGCGCAKKQPEILRSIAGENNRNAIQALMSHPTISEFIAMRFDSEKHDRVQHGAVSFREILLAENWDGGQYVETIKTVNPAGVETLKTADDAHHGHAENIIVVLINKTDKNLTISKSKMMELGLGQAFVVSANVLGDISQVVGAPRGEAGIQQAFQAALAEQVGTADALCHTSMKIGIMTIE